MSELGRDARSLIEAASGGDEPTAENRARVRAAVRASLVAAAAAGATATAKSSAAAAGVARAAVFAGVKTSTLFPLVLASAVGVGGAVYVHASKSQVGPVPAVSLPIAATVSATAAPEARSDEPSQEVTGPVAPEATAVPTERVESPSPAPLPPPPRARLRASAGAVGAEMVLIGDARDALRAGDGARGLALLDEHARRYPAGALGEERDAMRITALCLLGRVPEARAAASQFLWARPGSPQAARVRASCGLDYTF